MKKTQEKEGNDLYTLNYTIYLTKTKTNRLITKYVLDHAFQYGIEENIVQKGLELLEQESSLAISSTDEEILSKLFNNVSSIIKQRAKGNLPEQDYEKLRTCLNSVFNPTRLTCISRENIYRLIFSLKIYNSSEANDLLLNYLGEPELSARNLQEFIIMSALELGLPGINTFKLIRKYEDVIKAQPYISSSRPNAMTVVYWEEQQEKIHSYKELDNFLSQEGTCSFFAHTRNTPYLNLFNKLEGPIIDDTYPDKTTIISTKAFWRTLFGLCCPDDEHYSNYLLPKHINALAGHPVFRGIFKSYDAFASIERRETSLESGTYLLYVLASALEADDYETRESFEKACNIELNDSGFPSLNRLCTFDALVLDIYDLTLEKYIFNPIPLRDEFLKNLRTALIEITNMI